MAANPRVLQVRNLGLPARIVLLLSRVQPVTASIGTSAGLTAVVVVPAV